MSDPRNQIKIVPKKPRNPVVVQMISLRKREVIMKDRRKSRETRKDWKKEQW